MMKILKHKETHMGRVFMRQDQMRKVYANHVIKPDMKIMFEDKEKKSVTWRALDFTEDGPRMDQFCCKF